MHVINAVNVNDALVKGLDYLQRHGVYEETRNGTAVVAPRPVATTYEKPWQRVLFDPRRDANPFFHIFESLWIMAGRNDLAWPVKFNKQFAQYSDDGSTVRGSAYGYRWRYHFGWDQLLGIAEELRKNPSSRRCVLTMWDAMTGYYGSNDDSIAASADFFAAAHGSKDIPCNTHCYLDCRNKTLNLTVCNRSNDIWYGLYGANVVHFSVLQEWMAFATNTKIGAYTHFSHNYHYYPTIVKDCRPTNSIPYPEDHYPLVHRDAKSWLEEAEYFINNPEAHEAQFSEPFFREVAQPMYRAWMARQSKQSDGLKEALQIQATDWKQACTHWITRRIK